MPTLWWSLPQPVRAMMAPDGAGLQCSAVLPRVCGRHPCACLPTTSTHKWSWPREASPAQVRLPRARRGSCACPWAGALGVADRLCRSVSTSWCQDVEPRLRALRLCLSTTSFSRSMICTRVVQAKPCPDYTSSTDPLSVFGSASPAPTRLPEPSHAGRWLTVALGCPCHSRREWHFCHSRAFAGANMHSF
jgi:hypothetical protein